MKKLLIVVLAASLVGCSYNTYDAEPITTGNFTDEGPYGPLVEDEIPECFTIVHEWANNPPFESQKSESLGEYCRGD